MAKYAKGTVPRDIARERIAILLGQAEACRSADPVRAARYVELARDIAARQRIRMTKEQKRSFCRRCGASLVPGTTSRVRVARGRVVMTCTACGNIVRIPLAKKTEP